MKQFVAIGIQDYTVLVKIRDDAGAPATGLTEASIDIAYARVETDNDVTTTDVTPAALSALTDAHTDWGFEEVSATDHPGLYRLDIADAVFASGAWSAVVTITGTGLDPCDMEFVLVTGTLDKIYSDTTIIYSDTTVATSKTTQIYSDTTAIHSDTTHIHSDTTAIHTQTTACASKAIQIYSDTTIIYSDTTIIYSDTTIATSKAVQIYSDTAAIHTQTTTASSKAVQIYSDTTHIDSDTTLIGSDVARCESKAVQIYSDTTHVHSDTTAIHTQTTTIASDAAHIESDVARCESKAVQIYSDTTVIASDAALLETGRAEPAQGAPPATASFLVKNDYLYKAWRNKKTQTSTTFSLFNDDASTVDHKSTLSDDGTTLTVGEMATGP